MSRTTKASEESAFRVIPIDQIPTKKSRKKQQWLKLFENIPEGKAIVTSEKELGVAAKSISSTLRRYIREGVLPDVYQVKRRKEGNVLTIYILHLEKEDKDDD
jgi:hypothetical protein